MERNKEKLRRIFKATWISFIALIGMGILFFGLISAGVLGFMPSFEELENPKSTLASEIIGSDGEVYGKFFLENRTNISFDKLNKDLVNALVATEDVRFYNHSGIDFRGLLRVFKGLVTGDSSSGGGSTISQQLAKMLFPRENIHNKFALFLRKFREWVIAVKLERSYTKDEIIAMYLNKFDFINGAQGIKSAAQVYFNTTPDSLRLHQAAMLVGMAQNPSLYNPINRAERTKERRNIVLGQMLKYKFINSTQYNTYSKLPLDLHFQRVDHKVGLAPYFREYLRKIMLADEPERKDYATWQSQKFTEDSTEWENNTLYGWINKNKKADGSKYNLYTDGLKIHTTINTRMQRYAELAVTDHLSKELQPKFSYRFKNLRNPPFSNSMSTAEVDRIIATEVRNSDRRWSMKDAGFSEKEIQVAFKKPIEMSVFSWKGLKDTIMSPEDSIRYHLGFFRSSMMAMDPRTGEVKAWVGGPNFEYFMYDMVKLGKRQVGSTCKPYLYTLAMANGHFPCEKVPNVEQTFLLPDGTSWTANNSTPTDFDGTMVTLKWGLANSVNQVSAWVMKQFNPEVMKSIMRKMGIYSPIDAVPSMFLGPSDITLYEMVMSYSTFPNKGVYSTPIIVSKIEDKNGNLLAKFKSVQNEAIDEKTAYLMTQMLEGVVREGSGRRLVSSYEGHSDYNGFKNHIAGKTGTTQNQSDGWFVGFTPEIVAAVWTGGNLRSIHFEDISTGQGSNMALPIFGLFLKKVLADTSLHYNVDADFERPENFDINLDCNDESGLNDENTNDFF